MPPVSSPPHRLPALRNVVRSAPQALDACERRRRLLELGLALALGLALTLALTLVAALPAGFAAEIAAALSHAVMGPALPWLAVPLGACAVLVFMRPAFHSNPTWPTGPVRYRRVRLARGGCFIAGGVLCRHATGLHPTSTPSVSEPARRVGLLTPFDLVKALVHHGS